MLCLNFYRQDELKIGTLVGTDEMGNRYYENNLYFYGNILIFSYINIFNNYIKIKYLISGRNRWVEYHESVGLNYDASQIPAEWYGWIHYKTDLLPGDVIIFYQIFK